MVASAAPPRDAPRRSETGDLGVEVLEDGIGHYGLVEPQVGGAQPLLQLLEALFHFGSQLLDLPVGLGEPLPHLLEEDVQPPVGLPQIDEGDSLQEADDRDPENS